ncbi:SDR family NAD(P)-dependent oxidoreductase [Sphingomonas astaxanthinifaciens]|uniref:NADP-dependent 3-hydroxy acid dehydrogenase n=1 Tax=Sphingomonas astaxanthinifaciens DSM 22298 TaxID=1123267 RepID=A0ABQ5Z475_9SPHN|nr:SDR family NAD(P)-dependent oxidoreductase [Sphingomonas astaxanthinifaciens]GLR47594.1 NADP-dependent 3-hydroxy acid dehydrogenase [Sphingomonas astaxanthinifaciens DSM 22298]
MKTCLITGATAGIGAATARAFAGAGWRVIGTGRREERLRALQEELGAAFLPLTVDMQDIGALEDLARLEGEWSAVDCLVNNAGLAPPMADLQDSEWDKLRTVLDTNVTGLVALTRALMPKIIAAKGSIINLSSVAATYPYKGGAVYGATKAFVRQFSLMLRNDLAGTGVRVTSIEPGMIETEFTLVRNGGDQAASDALYAGIEPMTAEDLAETILWVASRPAHLNINALELMPTRQSWAGFATTRKA